jgi:hypothetical protein
MGFQSSGEVPIGEIGNDEIQEQDEIDGDLSPTDQGKWSSLRRSAVLLEFRFGWFFCASNGTQ